MLLTGFWSYLMKNTIYGIARSISFNLDVALKVKMLEDWGLIKCLPQLDKGLSSIKS